MNLGLEKGLFVSYKTLKTMLSSIMSFLKKLITFDSIYKYTSFKSPVYNLISTLLTNISYKSRRDSRFRLLYYCLRYIIDSKYILQKISLLRILKLLYEIKNIVSIE